MSQEHYVQTPFQYYHPEMVAQHKQEQQHMYFMQAMNMQAAVYEHNAMLMAQQQFHPATPTALQPSVDFVSSKRPTHRRGPSLAHRRGLSSIDINCTSLNFDMPCTPPLSASSSTLNTPLTVGGASTPMNVSFSAESLYGVKAGCEAEVSAEMLASLDWSNRRSPPLTPVYLGMPLSSLNSTCSEILQESPCPSLSPSPSPVSSSTPRQQHHHQHSVAGATITTCDPRDLLFTACNTSHACTPCDLPAVPSAYSGVQEVQQSLKECESYFCGPVVASAALVAPSAQYAFIGGEQTTVSFPADFASVPCPELITFNSTPDALDILSFTDEDYIENIDFVEGIDAAQVHAVMTPLEGPTKRVKRSDSLMSQMSQVSHMSQNIYGYDFKVEQDEVPFPDHHEYSHMHAEEMHGHPQSHAQYPGVMMMQNGNVGPRRGRKQSLTDDPSKQFRCDVCSRRFRRQEHLKRHFRSLHSTEKPFQCTKCKKSFSRSDNLAQHARTHLPGNQNAMTSDDDLTDSSDDLRGEILFNAANSAGSVSSSFSSSPSVAVTSTTLSSAESSSSDSANISKKRKRTA